MGHPPGESRDPNVPERSFRRFWLYYIALAVVAALVILVRL
jgi:hypothetical protein